MTGVAERRAESDVVERYLASYDEGLLSAALLLTMFVSVLGLVVLPFLARQRSYLLTIACLVAILIAAGLLLRHPPAVRVVLGRRRALRWAPAAACGIALAATGVQGSPLYFPGVSAVAIAAIFGRADAAIAAALLIGAMVAGDLAYGVSVVELRNDDDLPTTLAGILGYAFYAAAFSMMLSRSRAAVAQAARHALPALAAGLPADVVDATVEPEAPGTTPTAAAATVTALVEQAGLDTSERGKRHAEPISQITLTARQLEIVELLARGTSRPEIAEQLVIVESTVARHIREARERTGATTDDELVALAVAAGLITI